MCPRITIMSSTTHISRRDLIKPDLPVEDKNLQYSRSRPSRGLQSNSRQWHRQLTLHQIWVHSSQLKQEARVPTSMEHRSASGTNALNNQLTFLHPLPLHTTLRTIASLISSKNQELPGWNCKAPYRMQEVSKSSELLRPRGKARFQLQRGSLVAPFSRKRVRKRTNTERLNSVNHSLCSKMGTPTINSSRNRQRTMSSSWPICKPLTLSLEARLGQLITN